MVFAAACAASFGHAQSFVFEAADWINTEKPVTAESAKGKTVLAAFLYADCCSFSHGAEILSEIHKRFADKGLLVVGLHGDGVGKSHLAEVSETYKLAFPLAVDLDNATRKRYLPDKDGFVTGAPGFVVFRPDGEKVVFHNAEELAEAVENWFSD
jgi:peroxiredoxin